MERDSLLAMLFPGQGSQTSDMGEHVERFEPELAALAREVVGEDPFARAEESTRYTQPALFAAAVAGWRRLRTEWEPDLFAGHSLGEIAALVAAEALSTEDGLRLATARGRLMAEAAAAVGPSGMLALRATDRAEVDEVARELGLTVANDNAPDQIVLSGPVPALEQAKATFSDRGMRAKQLPVAGAFHSPAMAPAAERFRELLDEVEVHPARAPVLSCVTAEPFDDVRERLAQAITSPVRWLEVMGELRSRGVTRFVETGPGRVLTGLVRRSLEGVSAEAPLAHEAARV
jgi:[acyl-carrier-protein] S-malonyltransferase